jgi:hypothetical protein
MSDAINAQKHPVVKFDNWEVKRVERSQIREFIEKNHYSRSINGCIADYCFALFDSAGAMRGAMFFGRMAMANQWKKYSDRESDVIELRRLCCDDEAPRNSESFFIAKALKLLRSSWSGRIVVSYADKQYGHIGTIYAASNFKKVGEIAGAKVIMWNGKKYHDKTIRTKYKGELKPFAKKLKAALDAGNAKYEKTAGKVVWIMELKKAPSNAIRARGNT